MAQRMASLILLPVNTRFLSPSDFGVLELLEQVAVVVSLLLGGTYATALGFFYFEVEGEDSRRRVIGTTIIGSVILGAIAGFAGWFFSELASTAAFRTPEYAPYVRMMLISLPFSFVLEAEFSTLRVQNRAFALAVSSVLKALLTIVVTLVLVAGFRLRIWGILFSTFSVVSITTIGLGIYLFRRSMPLFDFRLFFRMWRFALPLGLSGFWMFIIHFGDRFILPRYRPLSDLGIYGLAYKLTMVISLVHASFHAYWSSQVYGILKRDDARSVFGRIFTYMILALSLCALILIAGAKPALRIMTPPAFQGAAALIPLLVGAYFVRAIGDFFRVLFFVANKPSGDAICNGVGAVVCLVGYFVLIPKYGIWGAAWATTSAFVVIGVISLVWAYTLYPYRLEAVRLVKLGVSLAFLCGLYFTVPVSSLWRQILWAALLVSAYPLMLLALRFPTTAERARALAYAQRFLPFVRVSQADQ
jgi:O-antigen/teichoic acid export membrane protein